MVEPEVYVESGALLSTDDLCALVGQLGRVSIAGDDTESVTQIECLERIKAAAAAAQAQITASFGQSRRAALEPARAQAREQRRPFPNPEASIGSEVGLARRESPHQGRRHLELADALTHDLPRTLAALSRGDISEDRAMVIATETDDLSREDRRAVDAELHADDRGVSGLGDLQLRDLVRRIVFRIDHDGVTRRWDRARARRRVTTRNLGDGTTRVSAIVKQEHAAAVQTALHAAAASARTAGDTRTSGQVKADTVVERITGLDTATATPLAVNLVVGAETLFGDSDGPGDIPGSGPVPAAFCRDLVFRASAATRATLRRLFAMPGDRDLVAMESKSRCFPVELNNLIRLREGGICRTPWCNAPIQHIDHVESVDEGGETSFDNGQGLCETCNYVKETPGWVTWVSPGTGPPEVGTLTPSHHVYTSRVPSQPGGPGGPPPGSIMEFYLSEFVLTA